MQSKRGVLEVQFNWIFVLIIGSLILVLFFAIMQKQKSMADFKLAMTMQSDLSTILTGARVSRGTASLNDWLGIEIYYDDQGYWIGPGRNIKVPADIDFAPSLIKGQRVLAWTVEWNVPYRAANFLFLTSTDYRYVIVDDNPSNPSLADELFDSSTKTSLPESTILYQGKEEVLMRKEMYDYSNFVDKNNYRVRFVFFKDPNNPPSFNIPNAIKGMSNEDVTAVWINPDPTTCTSGQLDCFGEVTFYQKDNNNFQQKGKSYYFGRASLFGAIFSDDINTYNTNMAKAFRRLETVTEIIKKRAQNLKIEYENTNNDNCKNVFDTIISDIQLSTIKTSANELIGFPPSDANELKKIYDLFDDLNDYNSALERYSCAYLY